MVKGLEVFREHFQDYADRYLLIGGAACDLAMSAAALPFRATKDLDIVLCVEALDAAFVQTFWEFVRAGGYENQEKATGEKQFYRFQKPTRPDYPFMLELFSRQPDVLQVAEGSHLTPLPVEEEASSLSAILLDNDFLSQAKREAEDGLKLKVMEKDQTIASMQQKIEELKQKAEQGSQQLQGEVQELEVENLLRVKFPYDTIEPVAKGEFGGDALQRVVSPGGVMSGTILWESKRTKNWNHNWLVKLRDERPQPEGDFVPPADRGTWCAGDGLAGAEDARPLGRRSAHRMGLLPPGRPAQRVGDNGGCAPCARILCRARSATQVRLVAHA
jgi:hypothetical protein